MRAFVFGLAVVSTLGAVLAVTLVRQHDLKGRVARLDALCEEYRETLCIALHDGTASTSMTPTLRRILVGGSFASRPLAVACGNGVSDELMNRLSQCQLKDDAACVRTIVNELMQGVPVPDGTDRMSLPAECRPR